MSLEYMDDAADEPGALVSRALLSRLLPLRVKMDLPKICTLSGRSRMLLVVDRPDDFRDKPTPSSHDGRSVDARERIDEEPEDDVCWLWCFSATDTRFICLLNARMLSGDGGPSMAGSRRPLMVCSSIASGKLLTAVVMLVLTSGSGTGGGGIVLDNAEPERVLTELIRRIVVFSMPG